MSRISQDFITSVGYLYEEINVQQQDFLNEDSQYHDAEATELVEDIISTISSMMVCEGYSADGIIGFLADSSEEAIIEKYLSFDESILTESTVSEEYIEEQLELLENRLKAAATLGKAALKTLFGRGPGYTATKLQGPRAPGLIDKGKALVSKAVGKVKDVASKAKAALTGPTAQKVAKGAGIFGLGAAGGYVGAKMAGAGAKPTESPKPADTKPPTAPKPPTTPKPTPAPSGNGVGSGKPKPAPAASKQTGDKEKDMAAWAKANPELAKRLKPDGTQKGTGQSQMEKDAEELRKMSNRSLQRQGELMGGPEGPGKIDTKDVDQALKAQQERDAARRKKEMEKAASSMKESYEPYEVLLEYLMSGGHADTIEEAHYIMLEMDASAVRAVMEEYEDYLLAEEVSEWVDGLLDEGHDLSKYSWDDIVEYYVSKN